MFTCSDLGRSFGAGVSSGHELPLVRFLKKRSSRSGEDLRTVARVDRHLVSRWRQGWRSNGGEFEDYVVGAAAVKGIMFREFVDFVEEAWGLELLDEVIRRAHLPVSQGAYTSVGTYPFSEMQGLVAGVCQLANCQPSELLYAFGRRLFSRFLVRYPQFFASVRCTFDFVERIDDHIHLEVRKLYPDAELPRFVAQREDYRLLLEYRSPRALSDLALGMLEASAEHFDESVNVERAALAKDGTRVVFTLEHTS